MHIHILGICGTFMGGIAAIARQAGHRVTGCDANVYPPMSTQLEAQGIELIEGYSTEQLSQLGSQPDLFVIGNVVSRGNPLMEAILNQGLPYVSGPQWLGEQVLYGRHVLAVAGTHGKTTTSAMLAWILEFNGKEPGYLIGGVPLNFTVSARLGNSNYFVIEADEYDRSFHHLSPYMAVITSSDADHLDIYETHKAVKESYEHFASLVRPGGALIVRKGIDIHPVLQKGVKAYTYSMDEGDFHAENIRIKPGEIRFDFVTPTERVVDVRLGVPVKINVENSVAAMALAWLNGVTSDELRTGLSSFSGIYRRFNVVYKSDTLVYIDDYAHHPSELSAGISSIREMYPGRRITGIFQPHLYTRTRDFADEFASVLSTLDEVILLDIYPARELPIEGVNSQMILDKINHDNKQLCSRENLIELLTGKEGMEVVVTFGAGDIDALVPAIRQVFKARKL